MQDGITHHQVYCIYNISSSNLGGCSVYLCVCVTNKRSLKSASLYSNMFPLTFPTLSLPIKPSNSISSTAIKSSIASKLHLHCMMHYKKPPCCTNVTIRRTEIIYVNKREQWIAAPPTKTLMENTSDSNMKVTNHVPKLSSSHISVTVNSVCVNTKTGKNATRLQNKFLRRGTSY